MISLRSRDISASARPRRLGALGGAVALAAGSMMALTACAVGAGCSGNAAGGGALSANGAAANSAGLGDPRGTVGVDPDGPPSGAVPAAAVRASSTTVTLITGDRVRVDSSASGQVVTPSPSPATGAQATGSPGFVRFSWGGDQYVVPDAAVPYAGSTLDLRLFDASYLVRAGLDDAHTKTLPLRVSGDPAGLPGLQAAGRSGGAAAASLAKTRTPAIGRLLASAYRGRTGSAGLGRLGSVTLAPPNGAPELPTLPAGPAQLPTAAGGQQHWHTVTLKFIGYDGTPATGIGWLQNLDDARLRTVLVNSDDPSDGVPPVRGATGPVSFSVPDGTYSLQVAVLTPHEGAPNGDDGALVVLPELTISSDQTFVLDARTASTYQASVDPAVTAPVRIDEVDVWRSSTTGGGCGGGAGGGQSLGLVSASGAGFPASRLGATPSSTKVKHGRLGFEAVSMLRTGADLGDPTPDPRYFMVFPSENTIPKSLTYTVPAGDLSTVRSHVYNNAITGCPGATPEMWPNVYFVWGAVEELRASGSPEGVNLSQVALGDHTDYWYTGDPGLTAFQGATVYENSDTKCFDGGIRYGQRRTLHPGEQIDETWNRAPEVPASAALPDLSTALGLPPYPTSQKEIDQTVAPATRQDDNGMVYLLRGGDSDPSHYMDDVSTYALSLERDGQPVLSAPFVPALNGAQAAPFRLDLPLSRQAATYKLDWTTESYPFNGNVAPKTETAWTFRSAPSDAQAKMPDGEQCAPDPSRGCSFLPLLFVHYDLALDFESRATAGQPLPITFSVSGQQGAPALKGTSATVSESFDAGKTWTTPVAAKSTDANTFTATVDQPPLAQTNGSAYLKVHVADAAGNAVDQTMTPAYGLTGGEG